VPYVIGRPPKRVLAVVVTTLGMFATASPALANSSNANPNSSGYQVPTVAPTPTSPTASCPSVIASSLLSSLGDTANYAPVAGGTFEDLTGGWTLNNAAVSSGNEPWYVVSATDSNSLNMAAGGSAVSPTFCVDNTFPSFRFFADSLGATSSPSGLTVSARYTLSTGQSGTVPITTLSASGYSAWSLTPSLPLGSSLATGQTATVQFVFSAGSGSAWNIDDVLLDPYAK
jgi:hypothetical protein